MDKGVEEERAESPRHDTRHAKRLATLLSELSERPVRSLPSACYG